jgi:hypothetical protein
MSDDKQTSIVAVDNKLMVSSDLWVTKAQVGYLVSYMADKVIGELIRSNGHFQEEEIFHAIQLLAKLGHSVRLTTFVDVGANIGTHTLWALRYGFESAVCIEADADNFRLLRVNQILNDMEARPRRGCHQAPSMAPLRSCMTCD